MERKIYDGKDRLIRGVVNDKTGIKTPRRWSVPQRYIIGTNITDGSKNFTSPTEGVTGSGAAYNAS